MSVEQDPEFFTPCPAETQAESEPANLPQAHSVFDVIQNIALRPDANIDAMERLYAMHEREIARQAEVAFADALANAQADMRPVVNNRKNDQTHSTYANLQAIADAIDPIITKHGFNKSFSQADCPVENHYRIIMLLQHRHGHSKEYHADIPIDAAGLKGNANKTQTHAFGSTMSYGRRYVKLLAFDIATGDDDGNDAGAGETITADQYREIRDKMDAAGADEDKFLAFLKISDLQTLPLVKYGVALAALNRKIAKKGGEGA